MGYPGDQGRPGGWSTEPPPAPFGPGGEPDEQGTSGKGQDESPFAPRLGEFAARPGESFGAGSGEPFNGGSGEPFGAAGGPAAGAAVPWEDAPAPAGSFGPGAFSEQAPPSPFESGGPSGQGGPGGPGGPGQGAGQGQQFDVPDELYGAMGERYFAADSGGGAGGGGFDNLGGGRQPAPAGRRNNLPLIIGGAAVAGLVLIGGGFGLSAMLKDEPKKPDPGKAAPQNPSAQKPAQPKQPPAKPQIAHLRSRATDPKPLSLKEVFGKAAFTEKGQKYVRTAWRADRACAKAVSGTRLSTALKKGGCTQALRATFTRADNKLIGTVGVLNLKSEAAAKAAERAGAGKDAFIQALPGIGSTKKIGKGLSLGTVAVRGHYVIMTWVQRPDGKAIAAKYHKTVSAFGTQVIVGSNLGKALKFRGYEGKPFTG